MKFLGIMSIVYGVFAALTIIGLIFAWAPIWMGALLMQSAKKAGISYQVGDEADAVESLSKLKTIFTIYGVLSIIGLVVMVLYFVVIIALISSGGFEEFFRRLRVGRAR
jgi:lipopolysaccharide/colanic/teichoic acid biosynthesis glycosyltransferase